MTALPTSATATALEDLAAALGAKVSTDPAVRASRGHDRSHLPWEPPSAVVRCTSTGDVSTALAICHRHGVPAVPIAAGTGLEGGANSTADAICLDLSGLDNILRIGADDLDATVQAGVMKSALNAALAGHGLTFPVGPGVDASVGGMASTGASGTTAVRYGTMKENVLGLTVVLADGTVIKTGGRARKSAAGYDLTHLFVGAEGTLGVLTEVTLRVYGIPEATGVAICSFPTLEACTAVVLATLTSGVPISRVELLDDVTVDAVNRYSGLGLPVLPTLIFEFEGSPSAVAEQSGTVRGLAARHGGTGWDYADDPERIGRIWRARHDALPSYAALVPGSSTWSTDVCVPISRLAECITLTKADTDAHGVLAPIVGHVGDGNFHLAFVLPPGDEGALAAAAAINGRLVDRALSMGGTSTGEHGIGLGKTASLAKEHASALPAMAAIKHALDPRGILNPGKVLAG
ncbi:FAD-binding oxidoreductase [Arthrobacter livingstonensis]|uniref:D-lactate dehydrogenase (cytochrome) n=1 Tax=Arthrobacter livingstonensis TaxID=670078 RepID=A0A2V5L865_9MICC|nr:FAD-linked oxidase C-terminal domain-containing protein [Arthrobacter livingstonensis]PYI66544.1 FAD-binding oxidoreductase [Arthrobacter livingstonensis]